jgi:hypothetical protein
VFLKKRTLKELHFAWFKLEPVEGTSVKENKIKIHKKILKERARNDVIYFVVIKYHEHSFLGYNDNL